MRTPQGCMIAVSSMFFPGVVMAGNVLLPGGSTSLAGTGVATRPELAGTVVYDALIPFQISDGGGALLFDGVLQNSVVRSDINGTLDFYYRIRDTREGLNGILDYLFTTDFSNWSTQVDFRLDGDGDVGPTFASGNAGLGDVIEFTFGGTPVISGTESFFMIIQTNATDFAEGGLTYPRVSTNVDFAIVDTVVPVPEPSMCLLLAGGTFVLARFRPRTRSLSAVRSRPSTAPSSGRHGSLRPVSRTISG